jgi:hypothetical protein
MRLFQNVVTSTRCDRDDLSTTLVQQFPHHVDRCHGIPDAVAPRAHRLRAGCNRCTSDPLPCRGTTSASTIGGRSLWHEKRIA